MKKILLPILMILTVGLFLISCDLFGDNDSDVKRLLFIVGKVTPTNYVFLEGDTDIKDHLTVKSYYTDGTVENLNKEDYSISPNSVTSTTNFITVTYEGKTDDVYINVGGNSETLDSIEILSLPTKTTYRENSKFDVSGLVVVGVYSDGSKRVITDYTLLLNDGESVGTVSGTDLSTTKTNTVTYESKTTSFEITVKKLSSYTLKKKSDWSTSVDRSHITKIVFDYTDNLPSNIREKIFNKPLIPIGNTENDIIYLLKEGTELYVFSDGIICGNSNCSDMFSNFNKLTEITLNNFDTSNVTDMSNMFYFCCSLTTLDIGGWDTTSVTDMDLMFDFCELLSTLNISSWDTSNVTTMEGMFSKCNSLTILNIKNWNTSNVKNMSGMFETTSLTTLDLSSWDTSKVEDMYAMFRQSTSLTTLNISGWNTTNVKDMRSMFSGCSNLQSLNLSNFNTSKVTQMDYMFKECENLTSLNLSSFDTSKVDSKDDMFNNCGKEETTVTINPTYESFFNGTDLGNTTIWDYSSPTYTHK